MEFLVGGVLILLILSLPLWIVYLILTAKKRKSNPVLAEKNRKEIEWLTKRTNQSSGLVARDDEVESDTENCPKCGCDDWKFASLVNLSGHSTNSSTSSGVGFALDAEGEFAGPGIGVGFSKGQQQTKLSELAAPPSKPISSTLILIVSLVISVIGLSTESPIIFVIFAVIAAMFGLGKWLSPNTDVIEKEKYAKALEAYSNKRVCQQCGTFYYFKSKEKALSELTEAPVMEILSTPQSQPLKETKDCPFCAETILAAALLCKHCKSPL